MSPRRKPIPGFTAAEVDYAGRRVHSLTNGRVPPREFLLCAQAVERVWATCVESRRELDPRRERPDELHARTLQGAVFDLGEALYSSAHVSIARDGLGHRPEFGEPPRSRIAPCWPTWKHPASEPKWSSLNLDPGGALRRRYPATHHLSSQAEPNERLLLDDLPMNVAGDPSP